MDLNTPAFRFQLQDAYELPFVRRIQPQHLNKHYQTYSVDTSKDRYQLKKYSHRDIQHLLNLHQFKQTLHQNQANIHRPLPMSKGQTIFAYADNYYALFPEQQHNPINPDLLTPEQVKTIGRTIGKLHLSHQHQPFLPELPISTPESTVHQAADLIRNLEQTAKSNPLHQQLLNILHHKVTEIDRLNYDLNSLQLPNHVPLHRSLPSHLHWNSQHLAPIGHWDLAAIGPRILELMQIIDRVFFRYDYSGLNILKAKLFLQSYHQVFPVTAEEIVLGLKAYYYLMVTSLNLEKSLVFNKDTRQNWQLPYRQHAIEYMQTKQPSLQKALTSSLSS